MVQLFHIWCCVFVTLLQKSLAKESYNPNNDISHLIKCISNTEIKHKDAWEIGTGINYTINELFQMFKEKFNIDSINIPDQRGNYRETLRINDDLVNLLNWQPQDRLKEYIANLNPTL